MCPARRTASTTPTSDWLMTEVGPPDWPMTALPLGILLMVSLPCWVVPRRSGEAPGIIGKGR
jgi:hypothetical protein